MTAKEYNDSIGDWADDVIRFATRVGGSREDGEDAVQEACASLWLHRTRVPVEKGKGYLLSTVYRQLLSRLRHRKVERMHVDTLLPDELVEPDTSFDLREALERALELLPEVQRAILQLRDVEGYSYHEIGECLKISDDRVQVYLFRARVAMRKQLILMGYDNNR